MVTARPECKSNCASGIVPTHIDEGYAISVTYNAADCLPDEENWIDVSLRIKGTRLHERFIIPRLPQTDSLLNHPEQFALY